MLVAADAASAKAAREKLAEVAAQARAAMPAGTAEARYLDGRLKVLEAQAAGIEALRSGKADAGVAHLKARRRPGDRPAGRVRPAGHREAVLGTARRRTGAARPRRRGKAAYREALKHAPGRRLSLAGAAR